MLNKNRFGWVILISSLVFGCTTPREVNQQPSVPVRNHLIEQMAEIQQPAYKVKPGDHLKIDVWDYPQFNVDSDVSSRGTIVIPLIGEMNVAGLTKSEITSKLNTSLKEYINGEINMTVTIRGVQRSTVFIMGSVRRPDNYSVSDTLTIFQALSIAGGADNTVDLRNIKIYRPYAVPHMVQVNAINYLKDGQLDKKAMIYPGDMVFVPQTQNVVEQMSLFLRDAVVIIGLFRVVN